MPGSRDFVGKMKPLELLEAVEFFDLMAARNAAVTGLLASG